jgi:ElaA protein
MPTLERRPFHDLDVVTLYKLLRLRSEVFVVEQNCVYLDLDGRDIEPEAEHVWIEDGDDVLACARVLRDADGSTRVGRIVVAQEGRGKGLGAQMITAVIESTSDDVVLEAQSQLVDWYASFGFVVTGPEYTEDSIMHTPMRRSGKQ